MLGNDSDNLLHFPTVASRRALISNTIVFSLAALQVPEVESKQGLLLAHLFFCQQLCQPFVQSQPLENETNLQWVSVACLLKNKIMRNSDCSANLDKTTSIHGGETFTERSRATKRVKEMFTLVNLLLIRFFGVSKQNKLESLYRERKRSWNRRSPIGRLM